MEQEALMLFSMKQKILTKSSTEVELVKVNNALGETMDKMTDVKLPSGQENKGTRNREYHSTR